MLDAINTEQTPAAAAAPAPGPAAPRVQLSRLVPQALLALSIYGASLVVQFVLAIAINIVDGKALVANNDWGSFGGSTLDDVSYLVFLTFVGGSYGDVRSAKFTRTADCSCAQAADSRSWRGSPCGLRMLVHSGWAALIQLTHPSHPALPL